MRPVIPDTTVCRICLWRLAQIAFHPSLFAFQEIERLEAEHKDVLAYALTTGGEGRWVWTADGWPERKDARTLR